MSADFAVSVQLEQWVKALKVGARVDVQGKELNGEVEGILAMKQSWPSIMRTLFGDHKRYEETYFSAYKVCCDASCAVLCCAVLC